MANTECKISKSLNSTNISKPNINTVTIMAQKFRKNGMAGNAEIKT